MPKQTKLETFDTDEYRVDRNPISGGSITEDGLIFKLDEEIAVNSGKWGKFYSMPIEYLAEGEEWQKGVINFTHSGLFKLVTAHYDQLIGQKAVIKGFGSGIDRKYTIALVED